MAKMVGLSRNLKIQWLNKTVELYASGLNEAEIKEQLNEYLSFEISSPTNLRKTREILMNIWVYENELAKGIKKDAVELINKDQDNALAMHWCMMLAAYPVFVDLCKLIGKMSEFQDEITLAQIKQKLYDEWGERSTLYHSIDKLVATLKNMDVLVCDKPGKYRINKHRISDQKVVILMVYLLMLIDDSGYYTFLDLNASSYLFPFSYDVKKEAIMEDERFVFNNFGGELTIALND